MDTNFDTELLKEIAESMWYETTNFVNDLCPSIALFFQHPSFYYNNFDAFMTGFFSIYIITEFFLFLSKFLWSKKTTQQFFRLNNYLSKIMASCSRIYAFMIYFETNIVPMFYLQQLIFFVFILEFFDMISFAILHKKITIRRIFYFLSYSFLILNLIWTYNSAVYYSTISLYFLGISYLCETYKDIFYMIFQVNASQVIYGIYQPLLLLLAFVIGSGKSMYFEELIVPTIVLLLSGYDGYLKCSSLVNLI